MVNGSFDENTSIAPSKFRTTSNTVFASELDEVTISGGSVAKREINDGTLQVGNAFDEVSLASGSVQFASTNLQCLSAAPGTDATAFNFGTGNFTAECFFYPTTTVLSYGTLITTSYPADVQGFFFGTYNNQLAFLLGNGTWFYTSPTLGSFTINAWNHAALVRSGTTYYLYLNGSRLFTTTQATAMTYTQNKMSVGGRNNTQGQIGYMSQVRVVKGTALYTGATYTVPNQGILPAVSGTVLLLNALTSTSFAQDNSGLQNVITNNVSCVWDTRNPFNT